MTALRIVAIVLSLISLGFAIASLISSAKAKKLSGKAQKNLSQQTNKTEVKNMEPFSGILVRLKKEPIEKFIDIEALEQYYVSRIRKGDDYADVPMDLMEKLLLVAIYKKLCLSNNGCNDFEKEEQLEKLRAETDGKRDDR